MKTVFIVQGAHWSTPGRPMIAHATRAGAEKSARKLVNIMLREMGLPIERKSAQAGIERVWAEGRREESDYYTAATPDSCDVWIEAKRVKA